MPTPGTFLLDGLLQGASPGEDELRAWIKEAAEAGLIFSLEVNGNQFSILADNRTFPVSRLNGVDLDVAMSGLLKSLLALYPAKRATLYSTLRSQEFRPGLEVQTIYLINSDGTVKAQSREITTQATPPPTPLTRRQRLMQAATLLAGLFLLLALSSYFINWRGLFHRVREVTQPTQGVELDASALAPYVDAKLTKVRQLDGSLEIQLLRGPQWAAAKPDDLDEPLVTPGGAGHTWREFLGIQAVKRGLIRCCFYDENGVCTGDTQLGIESLRTMEAFGAQITIPHSDAALKRVVLRP